MSPVPPEIVPKKPHFADVPVLFIDCQTSGASPQNSHLLEIAWRVSNEHLLTGRRSDDPLNFSSVVRLPAGCELTKRVSVLTGITVNDAAHAMPVDVVASRLRAVVGDIQAANGFAVIHFARFERIFIERLWAEHFSPERFELPIVCTHQLAKHLFPEFSGYGIRAVAGYFGMTMVDHKRAATHAEATAAVWDGLQPALMKCGVTSRAEIDTLLGKEQKRPKVSKEYRIPKEKRLALPSVPGVYSYYGKNGAVLYVGKATSLKSRVNSYFRRQRGGDARKNEMLMQAWDLKTEMTATPLEAALREFNLIQQWSPPYNLALRRKPEPFLYVDRQMHHAMETVRGENHYGPIDERFGLRDLLALAAWIREQSVTVASQNNSEKNVAEIPKALSFGMYGLTDAEILKSGFDEFCKSSGIDSIHSQRGNRILVLSGLRLLCEKWQRVKAEADAGTLFKKTEANDAASGEETATAADEKVWTSEDVAIKTAYIARYAARGVIETLWLRRLRQCEIRFRANSTDVWRVLKLADGDLVATATDIATATDADAPPYSDMLWTPLGLARLRTVAQELRRVLSRGGEAVVKPQSGPALHGKRLAALLAMGF